MGELEKLERAPIAMVIGETYNHVAIGAAKPQSPGATEAGGGRPVLVLRTIPVGSVPAGVEHLMHGLGPLRTARPVQVPKRAADFIWIQVSEASNAELHYPWRRASAG